MAAGLIGFGLYLASYVLLQVGKLDGNGLVYTVMNIAAASLVLVSLVESFNLASALIQLAWITFGVAGIWLRFRRAFGGAEVPAAIPVKSAG